MNTFDMRAPCPDCETTYGVIETINGQDTVRCGWCGRFCYNAPKTETGRESRSLRTRPDIKPKQRTQILNRDNQTCLICHRHDVPLDVRHLISVKDGLAHGLTETELYHDENLAAMCGPCNSGLSSETVPMRLLITALLIRVRNFQVPQLNNGATQHNTQHQEKTR
jgi:hypothetical protein